MEKRGKRGPLKNRGHPVLNPQGGPILRSAVQSNASLCGG